MPCNGEPLYDVVIAVGVAKKARANIEWLVFILEWMCSVVVLFLFILNSSNLICIFEKNLLYTVNMQNKTSVHKIVSLPQVFFQGKGFNVKVRTRNVDVDSCFTICQQGSNNVVLSKGDRYSFIFF